MTRLTATGIGFGAVLLWALLAVLTVGTAPAPPFLLNAICFSVGGALGLIWVAKTGGFAQLRAVSWRVYAFGTAGLFGYHALYFSALRLAPAATATPATRCAARIVPPPPMLPRVPAAPSVTLHTSGAR